jgi:hypothetical protein
MAALRLRRRLWRVQRAAGARAAPARPLLTPAFRVCVFALAHAQSLVAIDLTGDDDDAAPSRAGARTTHARRARAGACMRLTCRCLCVSRSHVRVHADVSKRRRTDAPPQPPQAPAPAPPAPQAPAPAHGGAAGGAPQAPVTPPLPTGKTQITLVGSAANGTKAVALAAQLGDAAGGVAAFNVSNYCSKNKTLAVLALGGADAAEKQRTAADAPRAVVQALRLGVPIIGEAALGALLVTRLRCPPETASAVQAVLACSAGGGAGRAGRAGGSGGGDAGGRTCSIFAVLTPALVSLAFFSRLRDDAALRTRVLNAAEAEYERIAGEPPQLNGRFPAYLCVHAPALGAALLAAGMRTWS